MRFEPALGFRRFKATGARIRPVGSNPARTGGSGQTAPAHRSAIAPPPPVAGGLNGEKQKCACPITRLLGRRAVLIAGRPTAGIDRAQGCAILRRDAQPRKWWTFRHGQSQRAARWADGRRNPEQNGRKREGLLPTDGHCRTSNPGTPGDEPHRHRRSKEGQTMANAPPLRIERTSDAFWMRALWGRGITIEAHHRQAANDAGSMLNGAAPP